MAASPLLSKGGILGTTGRICLMISATQCAAFAGLASDELILGVTPSAKHRSLLSSYLLNLERGPMAVRDMIVADLRRFRELGALQPTADLLLVLRLFLTDHPEARCVQKRERPWKKKSETRACNESGGGGERIEAAIQRARLSNWLVRDFKGRLWLRRGNMRLRTTLKCCVV
jgi:hypothetical protein